MRWNLGQTVPARAGDSTADSKCKNGNYGGICAFAQYVNEDTIDGKTMKAKVAELIGHECKGCGSVPFHAGNNVQNGELTIDFVPK
jgi:hypothetical protein